MKLSTSLALFSIVLIAGCQSTSSDAYVEVVAGDYRALAGCFSRQEVAEEETERNDRTDKADEQKQFTRRIEVDDQGARVIEVAVGSYAGMLYRQQYRVRFSAVDGEKTEVRGFAGIAAPVFWWPERVVPVVRRCSAQA